MSHDGALTDWVSSENPLTIQRRGHGLVGLGQTLTLRFRGPQRFLEASAAWKAISGSADIDNPLGEPGTGLVCFGSFSFSDESPTESVLVIPRVVIGRNTSKSWRTDISVVGQEIDTSESKRSHPAELAPLAFAPGLVSEDDFVGHVKTTIQALLDGQANKVVLARDLVAHAPGVQDWRAAINRLIDSYPDCTTFAIDGLVGSTPETLAGVHGHRLELRVLAGSTARGVNPTADRESAHQLVTSSKDNDEHRFAVNSVLKSLATITHHVVADEQPSTLKLANVWHLSTEIEATLPPATPDSRPPVAGDYAVAPAAGIFAPRVALGDRVTAGDTIGELINPLTGETTPVLAPTDGEIGGLAHRAWLEPADRVVYVG
jgi:menaquinone-specific isochorismate synthase